MKTVIALDVGGTEIKAGVLRGAEIIFSTRYATEREQGADHIVSRVLLAATELRAQFPEAEAIGLAVPGEVDVVNGIGVNSENLFWSNVPFVKLIKEATGLPVGFGHDVRAGGLAEVTYGAGIGHANSLFISLGTGIAGAMFIDGKLFDHPNGGEIGHISVGTPYTCACGGFGCLETVSTGPSIARIYNERQSAATQSVSSVVLASGALEVLNAAQSGDQVATEVWVEAANAIARALITYISLLAPDTIIIGGGISRAGAALIDPIQKELERIKSFQHLPLLLSPKLGDVAGMIGAGIYGAHEIDPSVKR
jgi:glucokinase